MVSTAMVSTAMVSARAAAPPEGGLLTTSLLTTSLLTTSLLTMRLRVELSEALLEGCLVVVGALGERFTRQVVLHRHLG